MGTSTIYLVAVIFTACFSLTFSCRGRLLRSGGLTCQDKRMIVDTHNHMRSMVASGRIAGQPAAANMLEMVWDEELARKAQQWADQCVNGHDSGATRRVARFAVGQNIASSWTSPYPNRLGEYPDFASQIQAWFSEVYQYRGGYSHSTGHYSQMVWGDTHSVGCGYSYSYDGSRYTKLYVCNYGPGQYQIYCISAQHNSLSPAYQQPYSGHECPWNFGVCHYIPKVGMFWVMMPTDEGTHPVLNSVCPLQGDLQDSVSPEECMTSPATMVEE